MTIDQEVNEFNIKSRGLTAEEIIRLAIQQFAGKIILASSLGEEDQVLTHMISLINPTMEIFTLDTGRLFQETYELLAKTQKRYPMPFHVYYPQTRDVEKMVKDKGINLFYESIENRKLCCGVRKVEPLKRALANHSAWISGIRREQSITRQNVEIFEIDSANQKIKVNPLASWSLDQVRDYIKKNNLDVNPLHSQGFISIGCACCTRAVKQGEDIRSGRWWWENPENKECGLHNNPRRPGK